MITSVSGQAYTFFCTIIGGAAIAFVYDIFRIFRRTIKTGNVATYAQDSLYWLVAAGIMFLTVYYSNDGQLRAYLFAGAAIGAVLYALLCSRIIMKSSLFIINIGARVIKAAVFLIAYPVRLLMRILNRPMKALFMGAKKGLSKIRCSNKSKIVKGSLFKKGFRHIKKK